MKGFVNRQKCVLEAAPVVSHVPITKCVTVVMFEEGGKTILQPVVTKQEAKTIQELFKNNTLEVWLSNGKPDMDQFDVEILKYKQVLQPFRKCSKIKNQVCMKNLTDTIVSCEQCPISVKKGAER